MHSRGWNVKQVLNDKRLSDYNLYTYNQGRFEDLADNIKYLLSPKHENNLNISRNDYIEELVEKIASASLSNNLDQGSISNAIEFVKNDNSRVVNKVKAAEILEILKGKFNEE